MPMQATRAVSAKVAESAQSDGGIMLVTAGDPQRLTGGYIYNRHILDALRNAGLPAVQVVLPEHHLIRAIVALQSALIRHRPALVIVDSIALAAAASLVSWVRACLRVRVVALMHMLPSALAPASSRSAMRHLEARLLSAADRIVAVSPSLRRQLIAAGASPERVAVITPGRDGIQTSLEMPGDRSGQRFLCVANWSPAKGIHILVEAMPRLERRLQLDLVGEEGDVLYARHIRDFIDQRGLGERVHVHGPLQGEVLAQRYREADVFVLPSISEGFGTVYAEAMSFGLPVIACRIEPLAWLVEKDCGLLVPPDDCIALAEAMGSLAADKALRRKMGEAAIRRSLRLSTWQESGERFSRLVHHLLDDQGAYAR